MTNGQSSFIANFPRWFNAIVFGVAVYFLIQFVGSFQKLSDDVNGIKNEMAKSNEHIKYMEKDVEALKVQMLNVEQGRWQKENR